MNWDGGNSVVFLCCSHYQHCHVYYTARRSSNWCVLSLVFKIKDSRKAYYVMSHIMRFIGMTLQIKDVKDRCAVSREF